MPSTVPDALEFETRDQEAGRTLHGGADGTSPILAEQVQALITSLRAEIAAAQAAADAATVEVGSSTRTSNIGGINSTTEVSIGSVSAVLEAGREYQIRWRGNIAISVGGTLARLRIRLTSTTGTQLQLANIEPIRTGADFPAELHARYTAVSSVSTTFVAACARQLGTGIVSSNANPNQPIVMTIERVGA